MIQRCKDTIFLENVLILFRIIKYPKEYFLQYRGN